MGDRIALMREGSLQQVSTPRDIYEHPRNMYVASFIGSPRMNLLPVAAEGRMLRGSCLEIELPFDVPAREAMLGIRPEDVFLPCPEGTPRLVLEVHIIESLGADQFLHGKVGANDFVARVRPDLSVSVGDRVEIGLNSQRLHLFDRQTEEAIPRLAEVPTSPGI